MRPYLCYFIIVALMITSLLIYLISVGATIQNAKLSSDIMDLQEENDQLETVIHQMANDCDLRYGQ